MAGILALLAAVIVFCAYMLVDKLLVDRKRAELVRARLAPDGTTLDGEGDDPVFTMSGDPSPGAQGLKNILRLLGVDVDAGVRILARRFAQAGINSPDAPIHYLFFQRVASFVLVLFAALLFVKASGDMALAIKMSALLLLVMGLFGPKLYLQNLIDKRKKLLTRAFPDTLDLLLICVESGLALDAALTRVCNELGRAYPEMTGELNRTRLELSLINDRVRALMNLAERTDLVAFRSLCSALIQSERFGTSLTDTLRVLSDEFRIQRLTDAEVKAARLPVIITIPLMLLLMPAFFLIVLGPAIVSFVRDGQQVTGKK